VITAILSCRTIKEAAEQSRVSERSIMRWLKEPEFQTQYQAAKSELLQATVNRLRTVAMDAVTTLHVVATEESNPPASRVSAGRAILEMLLRAVEVEDLCKRLDRLERSVKEAE
jgi:hypothetical protein